MLRKLLGWLQPAPIDAERWQRLTAELPFLAHLDDGQRQRLKTLCESFLADKTISGAEGFEVDDDVRLAIAVQACLPALRTGLAPYADFVEIIVYPERFIAPRRLVDDAGVVHEFDDELAGEAMEGGPIVLAWPDADPTAGQVGYNVVIHEFAHKLDMENGGVDGLPPLPAHMSRSAWAAAFGAAYERFCAQVDGDEDIVLDPYAAEHPGEFFAVASEAFFETPALLQAEFPEVYDQLHRYYGLDPAAGGARRRS